MGELVAQEEVGNEEKKKKKNFTIKTVIKPPVI